eukprot:symbB.v1.2.018574.t1/scaffold1485.1/size118442/6
MSPTLRLCSRTREYRRLAATWTASTPSTAWVVEVGCHEGVTSHILAQRNEGRVLAVDRSRHAVQMAQRRFPALHLGVLDASSPRLAEELLLLLHPLGASPADVACYFVDLGGDATLSSVVRALGRLLEQAPKNVEVVVKSEELLRLYRNRKPGDSAGPGQYDAHKYRAVANGALGGRIMPPGAEPAVARPSQTPGPGHYVAKGIAQSEKPVYSAFASQSQRGPTKQEHKVAAETPGPGQYVPRINRRPNMRELHPELQYFGSTAERFKKDEAAVIAGRLPGPGAYGFADYKNKGKSFAWLKGKRFQEPSKKQDFQPGPGAYYDEKNGWRHGSTSILGSSGTLAFGSMEARRGLSDPKKGQEPGPGAYYDGLEESSSVSGGATGRKPHRMFPPSSFFRSTVPKDVMVAQYQKDGQVGPPPGACPWLLFQVKNPPFAASLVVRYSPRLEKDLGTIQRLAPKNEGFGSAAQRLQSEAAPNVGPGPGWYKVKDVTGGKISGTFNRHAVDGVPVSGKPRGLGFESQSKRFTPGDPKGEVLPGPGTYNTRKDSDWITLTHNIYFGDFA